MTNEIPRKVTLEGKRRVKLVQGTVIERGPFTGICGDQRVTIKRKKRGSSPLRPARHHAARGLFRAGFTTAAWHLSGLPQPQPVRATGRCLEAKSPPIKLLPKRRGGQSPPLRRCGQCLCNGNGDLDPALDAAVVEVLGCVRH